MAIGTIRLTLDTFVYNHIPEIVVVKGDYKARFIEAVITAKGVPIHVSSTASVTINASRPDGKSNFYDGIANDDGSVCVPLTQDMSKVVGRVKCNISVVDDGKKISTTHFYIQVQEPPHDPSNISDEDPVVISKIEETHNLLLKVQAGELKDAYGYAVEGGYDGSKEKFAVDINPENILDKATPTKGKDYFDGTGVTISSVEKSEDDEGDNIVTFSDGTTLTIKNGSKGGKGDRGEPGASTVEAEQARDEAVEARNEAVEAAVEAEKVRGRTEADALAIEEIHQDILRNAPSVQALTGTDITVSLNNNIEYRANGVTNLNIRKFNPRCVIYDAADIVANNRIVTEMDGLGYNDYVESSGIVDDCVRFVAKTTGGTPTSNDRAVIKTDSVILKNYPFVRVAYKTNIAVANLNFNMVTENGYYDRSERKLFFKQKRVADEKIHVGIATYDGKYDKAIDSVYAECVAIYIPIWSDTGSERLSDDYFDVQYIGFFESLEDANNFDFDIYSSDEDKSPFPEKMGLYSIQFTTGDDISVSLPASVSWIINEPTFEPNKTYWLDFYSTTDGGFVGYDKLYAVENAVNDVKETAKRVEDAHGHPPYIEDFLGHWVVWDAENSKYKDTGIVAKGEQGIPGKQGEPGASGQPKVVIYDEREPHTGLASFYGWLYSNEELRITIPANSIQIELFATSDNENIADSWSMSFTAENIYYGDSLEIGTPCVILPECVEWAVAEPVFTAGYTYYLSFIPFGDKILGVWVAKELTANE